VIIGIDAASTDLSVALAETDGRPIGSDAWTSGHRQSAELLPRLLSLLERHRRRIDDAELVAVGIGPGSFTGLRVAMSLAKGLATALDTLIIGVPSLASWLDAEPAAAAALARAGAREGFLLARGTDDVVIVDRDALPESLASALVVAPKELAEAFGLADARQPIGAALAIARHGAERLQHGAADDLTTLEPRYLRGPRGVPASAEGAIRWL
jgi:tRNA threonylcarbamoyl adenosine modification protein YeaZ